METVTRVIEGTWEEISQQSDLLAGHRLRVAILPNKSEEVSNTENRQDPTLALFEQWAKEDAEMTPEERQAEDDLWETFEKNINETRAATGMRTL